MIPLHRRTWIPCYTTGCDVNADWKCEKCDKAWCVVCCYWIAGGPGCRPCIESMMPDNAVPEIAMAVDGSAETNVVLEAQLPPAQPADEKEEVLDVFFCAGCTRLISTNEENKSWGCRSCGLQLFECSVQIKQLVCSVCNECLPTTEATRAHRRWCGVAMQWTK